MRRSVFAVVFAGLAYAGLASPSSATTEYNNLLRLAPSDANAIILINATGMFDSEYAQANFWDQQRKLKAADHAAIIPLGALKYARAASLDLSNLTPNWEVVAFTHQDAFTADHIAKAEGGQIDKIDGLDAAVSPRDFYAVRFSDKVTGAMTPANRQAVVRWVRSVKDKIKPDLAPYLSGVVAGADMQDTQFVMAIDLEGIASSLDIYPDIAASPLVKDNNLDPVHVAEVVASLRGVDFTMKLTSIVEGKITFTFAEDPKVLEPVMKEAIIKAMSNHGAYIAETQAWTAKLEGKSISLSGELGQSGIRRIGSMLTLPSPDTKPDDKELPEEELNPVAASQRYFKSVQAIVNDVKLADSPVEISQIAMYLDRYARKINQLPILNVDPELLGWGQYVSSSLRAASNRLTDVRLKTSARAAQHSNFYDTRDTGGAPTRTVAFEYRGRNYSRANYDGGYGRYDRGGSYYNYNNSRGWQLYDIQYGEERYRQKYQSRERRSIALEERAAGKQDAIQIMEDVENSTNDMRNKMTQKYKVEF